MSEETWSATVTVTDHGTWNPTDEDACAALIAAVNTLRSPENGRPCIRRGWWSNDDDPWLDVHIGHASMRLDAGNHLVSIVLPDGSTTWEPLDGEDLARLRPDPEKHSKEQAMSTFMVDMQTRRESGLCSSRGPRIGSDGQPRCRLPIGHEGAHRPDESDGWGATVTWTDPRS